MARTFLPFEARIRAITPASVVFPTPPFPEIAIFIVVVSPKNKGLRVLGFKDSRW
jgi:hypothetical protein